MEIQRDYEDLLRLFNKHKVRYCIIGAYALAFYGMPRYTKDMDVLVEPDTENAKKMVKALNEFGFASTKLSLKDFTKKGMIIQLGYEPVRVDIITSITGVNFKDIWKNRKRGAYGKQKALFIGRNDLIRIKRISNRKQDQIDINFLRRDCNYKCEK